MDIVDLGWSLKFHILTKLPGYVSAARKGLLSGKVLGSFSNLLPELSHIITTGCKGGCLCIGRGKREERRREFLGLSARMLLKTQAMVASEAIG